jgi:AraC-like DNA-binding protein
MPAPLATDNRQALDTRTSEPLLWLHGAGHETRGDRRYYFDCRKRNDPPHVNLQLTLAGEGFYAPAGGARTVLPAGRAWIDVIPGRFEYGYHPSPRPYEHVFLSLGGPVSMRWATRLFRDFGHVLDFGPRSAVEAQMLTLAHAREAATLPDRYLLSGQLYQLIMTIYSALRGSRVSTNPRIARAMDLIAAHAHEHAFNIDALAERLDCSREYLSRQFRATAGVTPSDYLTQHRIRLAARLMRETSDKLDAIAHRCGLSGANYLCRLFRTQTGVTPAQFRARPWMVV